MYLTINKITGKIVATYETASQNKPSLTAEEAETTMQIKVDKKDLPKGQLISRKKVNLESLENGELVLETDETQVVPFDLTTEEGKQKLKDELKKQRPIDIPKDK